jgi:hypothetical protein
LGAGAGDRVGVAGGDLAGFVCLRSDSSDGRAGRVRTEVVFEAMATFFRVRLSPADIRLKEGAVCAP